MTGFERQTIQRSCAIGGVTLGVLLSPLRDDHTANVRHAVMYCLRKRHGTTFKRIGAILNRDHSTVVHGVDKVQDMLHMPNCPQVIRDIVREINAGDSPAGRVDWAPPEIAERRDDGA